jgi:hypothetical protein
MKEGLLLLELLDVMSEQEQNEVIDLLSSKNIVELRQTLIKIIKKYKDHLAYIF